MDTSLIINPGSSSKKYAFYQDGVQVLAVRFEKTTGGFGRSVSINDVLKHTDEVSERDYGASLREVISLAKKSEIIDSAHDLTEVGVRIVAPGEFFQRHQSITDVYLKRLEALASVAPAHIPVMLEEIGFARQLLPHARLAGISDSAFHSTIAPHLYRYGIPEADEEAFGVRRYGYHGLSVGSVARRLEAVFGTMPKRTVVVHLGSGVSVTALCNGSSIDTSMGFTPTSGVMMGTRAGDIDPGALVYLLEQKKLKGKAAQQYISEQGGFKGRAGTSDIRVLLERAERGEHKASETMQSFLAEVQKRIGAGAALLGGLDALVLTATALERNPELRTILLRELSFLGIKLDQNVNQKSKNTNALISDLNSKVAVAVMKTDEMGEMYEMLRA